MTARATAALRAAEPSRTTRSLRLVPPLRAPAPRAPFVVLLAGLLTAGLAGLLMLQTALAQDSFRLADLKARSTVLAEREQALAQLVAREAAPQRLAARAAALGMVAAQNPAFIRLSDGKVLGRPRPAAAPAPPTASPSPAASARQQAGGRPSPGSSPAAARTRR